MYVEAAVDGKQVLAETLACDQATLTRLHDLHPRLLRAYRAQQWDVAETVLDLAALVGLA